MRTVSERNALNVEDRKPAFVYVDEAATFFRAADTIQNFMTSARQCRVGGIFASQTLAQAGHDLRSSLMTNTATKLVSNRAVDDAPAFAPHKGYTPQEFREFMQQMEQYHFACTIAGVVDRAVDITVPFGEIDKELPMSTEAYWPFAERNRRRVSQQRQQEQPRQERRQQEEYRQSRQEEPEPEKPEQPPHRWTEMDVQALADAPAQLAHTLYGARTQNTPQSYENTSTTSKTAERRARTTTEQKPTTPRKPSSCAPERRAVNADAQRNGAARSWDANIVTHTART